MGQKKRRRWIILGLLLIIGVLVAKAIMGNKDSDEIEVETTEVKTRTIRERVSASGRIYPEVEVVISSDVSGEIVALYVEEGDSVIAGQVLLKIDPDAYVSAVERGEADVNNTKSQLSSARAEIATNEAQIKEQQTVLTQAQREHDRNIQLYKDGVISEVVYNQTLAQVESAQASIASAKARMKAAEESILGAQYAVKSAEAVLKELRTNLNRTVIRAPSHGIITSLSVEKGERVVGTAQMTGTEIMRISNLSTMEVQVEVSENDILKVELDDLVEIEVDAYIDQSFVGRVTEIANSATNVAGTTSQSSLNTDQVTNFIVKVRIDPESYAYMTRDGKYAFRPGMSASVEIITDVREDVRALPIQSVAVRALDDEQEIEGDQQEYEEIVFAMEADTARRITVKTGIQDDEFIQILSDIDQGLSIISGPYSALSKEIDSGSKVKRKEEDKDDKKKRK